MVCYIFTSGECVSDTLTGRRFRGGRGGITALESDK